MIFSVLIVEDHPEIREVLCAAIAHAGFYVFEAGSGTKALEMLSELPNLHAVVADFHLPEGHGLVPALKQARPKLPVLVLSGDPHRAHQALQEAALVLGKPVSPRVLVSELQRLINVDESERSQSREGKRAFGSERDDCGQDRSS